MARKRKRKKRGFSSVDRARLGAREAIGTPPPSRAFPSKKRKPPKHKKSLLEGDADSW